MTFTQAIRTCFSKYVTFSGRASRPEYWYFFLFVFVGGMIATVLDMRLFPGSVDMVEIADEDRGGERAQTSGPIALVFSLVIFLPLTAVGWRRMHDSGRSGLHLVYPLIVMIGTATFSAFGMGLAESFGEPGTLLSAITAIVLFCTLAVLIVSPLLVLWWLGRPTEAGANRFGPDPRGAMP